MARLPRLKSKRSYFYIFLVVFIAIGSYLAVSEASPKKGNSGFKNKASLQVSYSDEKPVSVLRGSSGKITYVSRPRTISVSENNTLFCTPEDNGEITSRTLSQSEQAQLKNRIAESRSDKPQDEQRTPSSNINNTKVIFVKDGASAKAVDEKPLGQSNEYIDQTATFLEGLCNVASNAIDDKDVPVWTDNDIVSSHGDGSLLNRVGRLVVPTAHAGGETTANGVDTAAENQQHFLINQARQQIGLPSYTRSSCLDAAAREWSTIMARDRWLRHSYPVAALPNKYCGVNSWSALGENVGVAPTPYSIDPAVSIQTSTTLFNAFMASPAHKANIVNTGYTQLGVGAHKSSDGKLLYVTHVFLRPRSTK